MKKIPRPSIERYCRLYGYLETLKEKGIERVQSGELGRLLGVPGFTIRKDLSFITKESRTERSYNVQDLLDLIGSHFDFGRKRNACVVGLGRIGAALLAYKNFSGQGFNIVAGFDNSINILELIKTEVKVYPSYQMEEVIKREEIEVALIAVPAESAQEVAEQLFKAGIKGILNFAPVVISGPEDRVTKNVDFTNMLREVVAFQRSNEFAEVL